MFLRPLWWCLHSPGLADKEAVQRPMAKGSACACGGGGRRRGRRHGRSVLVLSHFFFFFFDITEGGTTGTGERKSEQTGGSRGGGASGFFRCPTFRGGGGNSGFTRPSQGQTLLFMQPGREQTPGTLQRQATSHAQRSLVITGSAAWPRHSHVNIHTGRHFAWKSVINDPNQRKWRISTCNVNVLGYDTTNAQAIINSKGKHVDRIVVFNASMTCLEEYAAGLRLHRV